MIAHFKFKFLFVGLVILLSLCIAFPISASSPIPSSVVGRVKAYYLRYVVNVPEYSDGYLDSYGNFVSETSLNYRTSSFIRLDVNSPDIPRSIVLFNSYSSALNYIYAISFYDIDYNFIPGFGFSIDSPSSHFYSNIPDGAVYVRFTRSSNSSGSTAVSRLKALFVPEYIDSEPSLDYFWSYPIDLTVDSDGWVYLPYQVYTVDSLYFDIDFFGDEYVSTSSVDTLIYFEIKNSFETSNEWVPFSLPDSSLDLSFRTYFSDSLGRHYNSDLYVSDLNDSSKGLVNFSTDINPSLFSGYTFSVDSLFVSSYIRFRVWNLFLGSVPVDVTLTVYDVLNELDSLASALALPTPDLDYLLNVDSVLNNQNDTNASGILSVIYSDGGIITTMMVISVSVTVLGYILFGKKEA